jgi:hypothetical protein
VEAIIYEGYEDQEMMDLVDDDDEGTNTITGQVVDL